MEVAIRRKVSSNSSSSDGAYMTGHMGTVRICKLGLMMGQHVDIIAIYRRHRYYRVFPGPTATRCCSC